MNEAFAMALLVSTKGLSYTKRASLLREAGSALGVIAEPRAFSLLLGDELLHALLNSIRGAQALRDQFAREQVHLVPLGGEDYPPALAHISSPPHLLFVQGEKDLSDARTFAIVGTRKASDYGLRHTTAIACGLAQAGICIVSGLALGIDAAAHAGALNGQGRTVAVLGGALDQFYPAANRPLMESILSSGGSVISEFPMGMRPTRYSFLQRNRIIAGMCQGVLVTEGGMTSGALRTAHDALDAGRDVFALPGSVDSELSRLPNQLISEGAYLTTCAQDILHTLFPDVKADLPVQKAPPRTPDPPQTKPASRPAKPSKQPKTQKSASKPAAAPTADGAPAIQQPAHTPQTSEPDGHSEQERAVLRVLEQGEADFDALCEQTGIPSNALSALLMMMEMNGDIDALPGLRYVRSR